MLLGLLSSEAMAQKTFILSNIDHKGFVNITAGYSMPTCHTPFGKNTQDMLGSGQFAQTSVGYRIGRRLGVVGSFSYVSNAVSQDFLTESIGKELAAGGWKTDISDCTMQTLMVGPLLSVPAGRFLFDFQITGGVARSLSPSVEVYSERPGSLARYQSPSQTTYAPAAGAGVVARYKLSRWLAAHASAQYLAANLENENLAQQIQVVSPSPATSVSAHQPIGLMNWGVGLSFIF